MLNNEIIVEKILSFIKQLGFSINSNGASEDQVKYMIIMLWKEHSKHLRRNNYRRYISKVKQKNKQQPAS